MPAAVEEGQVYLHIPNAEMVVLTADVCPSHLTCPEIDALPN